MLTVTADSRRSRGRDRRAV